MTSPIPFLLLFLLLGACAKTPPPTQTAAVSPNTTGPESPPLASAPATSPPPSPYPKQEEGAVIGTAKKYKEDPSYKPTSCKDVGDHVGYASCCNGSYCAGYCDPKLGCHCDSTSGCLWPEVCGTSCVGPLAAVVWKEQNGIPTPFGAVSGQQVTGGEYIKKAKIVDEGNTCGLPPEPQTPDEVAKKHADRRIWSCCQGKLCPGRCVTRPSNPQPHCECAGLDGGCVSPHICCASLGVYGGCIDENQCPTTAQWPP